MSCEGHRDRLLELAYGELPEREARKVEVHASACPSCGSALARIRETRRMMSALPLEPAPEEGERILLAAGREAAERNAAGRRRRLFTWAMPVGVAAVLAAALSWRLLGVAPGPLGGDDLRALEGGGRPEAVEQKPAAARTGDAEEGPPPAPAPAPRLAPAPDRSSSPSRSRNEAPAPRRAAERETSAEGRDERPAPQGFAEPPPAPAAKSAERAEAPAAPAARSAMREESPPAPSALGAEQGFAARGGGQGAAASPAPAPQRKASARPAVESATEAPSAADEAQPFRADAGAHSRYDRLRVGGGLEAVVRTFPGCEGESRRTVERDQEGNVVRYLREGRLAGRTLRIEHLYGADGRLAAVDVRDVDRPAERLDPGSLGIQAPERAREADADAPPRCGR